MTGSGPWGAHVHRGEAYSEVVKPGLWALRGHPARGGLSSPLPGEPPSRVPSLGPCTQPPVLSCLDGPPLQPPKPGVLSPPPRRTFCCQRSDQSPPAVSVTGSVRGGPAGRLPSWTCLATPAHGGACLRPAALHRHTHRAARGWTPGTRGRGCAAGPPGEGRVHRSSCVQAQCRRGYEPTSEGNLVAQGREV